MPRCTICDTSNLYGDSDVFTVEEDVNIYRNPPFQRGPRHRICKLCMDKVEKENKITLTIVTEYISKTNLIDPYKTMIARGIRRKRSWKERRRQQQQQTETNTTTLATTATKEDKEERRRSLGNK